MTTRSSVLPASRNRRRGHWNVLLAAGTIAGCGLVAGAANAANITIITSGTITTGSESADQFGAGPNLAGDSYTLTVEYDALGASYATAPGFASDVGDPITGFVIATVDGISITTDFTTGTSATLIEDLNSVFAGNSGFDAAGDFADVSQGVASTNNFVPLADLQTEFSYASRPGDTASDSYLFTNAGDTATAGFTGVPSSVELLVPEPETWAMMASGLLGLGLLMRRRRG